MFHGQGWRKPIHGPRLAGRLKPFRSRQPTCETPRPREERPSAAPSWWLANPHRNPLPPPRLRPAPTHSVSLGAPRHTSAPPPPAQVPPPPHLLEIPLLIRRVIITPPLPPPSPTRRSPSTLRASTSSIVAVTSHPGPWITLRDRSAALARTCGSMHSGKEAMHNSRKRNKSATLSVCSPPCSRNPRRATDGHLSQGPRTELCGPSWVVGQRRTRRAAKGRLATSLSRRLRKVKET